MKRLMIIAVIAIIAMAASWNFNQSKNEVVLTDLALANVEALARNEGVDVVCSRTCADGIGKCWFRFGGSCVRSSSTNIYCTC